MVAHVLGIAAARGDGERAAHGRRVRRQGDAGQPLRRGRRAGGQEARPRGEDPARPRRRHADRPASGTISSSTTTSASTTTGKIEAVDAVYAARAGFSADLAGPVTDRALFHCDNAYWYPAVRARSRAALHQHAVSNTAFRGFGGPQGMVGGERCDRGDRLRARQGSARDPQGQLLRHRPTTTSRPTTRRSRTTSSTAWSTSSRPRPTTRSAAPAILAFNAKSGVLSKGIALTPVKFGISLHRHLVQPGRRAGARLSRRLDPSEPRRHRDGAGAPHQGGAGGGRCVRRRHRPRQDHRDARPARCPTPRRPPPRRAPTSTAWRRSTRPTRSRRAWMRMRRGSTRSSRRGCALGVRRHPGRAAVRAVRRAGDLGLHEPRAALGRRLLHDAEDPLGPRHRPRPSVLLLRLRRRGAAR